DGKVVGYNGDGELVEGEDITSGVVEKTDDKKYKLRAEISDGHIRYFINDEIVCDTKQDFFEKGRFGFNVYGGETNFQDVKLNNDEPSDETTIEGSDLTFDNNPGDLHVSGDSYVVDKGRAENGFAFSDQEIDTDKNTYEFEVDAKMLGDWHAYRGGNGDIAGVVLFAQGDDFFRDGGIVANVGKWGHCRIFARYYDEDAKEMKEDDLFNEDAVKEPKFNRFNMKIKLEGNRIIFIVNGEEVFNGEQNYYTTGKFGFNVWNGPSEFRNIKLETTEKDAEPVAQELTEEQATDMTETPAVGETTGNEKEETLLVEYNNESDEEGITDITETPAADETTGNENEETLPVEDDNESAADETTEEENEETLPVGNDNEPVEEGTTNITE
ncbi:MAG: DUF1080 domain-containing protein, partial [Clostridium sp.]|nr:DUF1080 domain-containing protein [Clostridium sp.]